MAYVSDTTDQIIASNVARVFAALGLLVFGAGSLFVWLFNPVTMKIIPACPMLSITGHACPGCGLTRGFHALFQGDIVTALDFNALIPFYVLGFAYICFSLVLVVIRGRGLPYKALTPILLFSFLVISVIFGIVRNIPSYPFNVLFP